MCVPAITTLLQAHRLTCKGTDLQSSEQVAIKLEHTRRGSGKLKLEAEAYRALAGGAGVPRVLWFGEECDYYVLVLDLLGPSLEDLFNYCGRRFSLKTVLLVADQLLTRIEYIHSKSLVHRDVKPDNFLVGTGRQGNTVYAIDFGLAEDYRTVHSRGRHEGTCRYASISFHNGEGRSQPRTGFSVLTPPRQSSTDGTTSSRLATCWCTSSADRCRGRG